MSPLRWLDAKNALIGVYRQSCGCIRHCIAENKAATVEGVIYAVAFVKAGAMLGRACVLAAERSDWRNRRRAVGVSTGILRRRPSSPNGLTAARRAGIVAWR